MPHELANWTEPRTTGPASIHATYLKTDVDEDSWDRAIIGFTGAQRHFDVHGRFRYDRVDGSKRLAEKIIEVVRRHQDEILKACGFVYGS